MFLHYVRITLQTLTQEALSTILTGGGYHSSDNGCMRGIGIAALHGGAKVAIQRLRVCSSIAKGTGESGYAAG